MRYCFKVSADYDVRNDTLMPADKFRKIARCIKMDTLYPPGQDVPQKN